MNLFEKQEVVGVFRGFREGGMEFHADLVLPYRSDFQSIPMHGQFLLVQLETPDEAVLGRIASFSSEGKLSFGSGEEFNIRAMQESREIPDDLRSQYLKYRVNIRVLGVLRTSNSALIFVPSHRRLPHVGSLVAFPSGEVLREICGHNVVGATIGHYALGEYLYAAGSQGVGHGEIQNWMRIKNPEVSVRFAVESLVSRRSFIFARAGFGKSNLNKLLFSKLYEKSPMVEKRGGRHVPVGTVIFDPDGEYFWPDDKGRPGLCDAPHLQDKLVVFTSRSAPSKFYGSFVAGGIRLDIRQLRPSDVLSIALAPERQDQQNVAKLRALSAQRWTRLVDLIDHHRNLAELEEVCEILGLDPDRQEAEAIAARSNMTNVVNMLHDRSSQLLGLLMQALQEGKLCVVDVSQMRGTAAFVLAGIVLRRIFDRNQFEFTRAEPKTIPTIAVIEEAQTVLNEKAAAAEPFIAWVKEGRKYDLGAVLVTQQPGSIPDEILSQGDNWFIFHLLATSDLGSVRKANAHFSDDLLSSLLNEPIPGQGVFWSSVAGKPYPISMRVLSFEAAYKLQDSKYDREAVDCYAARLRKTDEAIQDEARAHVLVPELASVEDANAASDSDPSLFPDSPDEPAVDLETVYRRRALDAVTADKALVGRLADTGTAWRAVLECIRKALPDTIDDKPTKAHQLVPPTLDQLFGKQPTGWHTYRTERDVTYVKKGPKQS